MLSQELSAVICGSRDPASPAVAGSVVAELGLAQEQAEVSMCVCPCLGVSPRPRMGFAKCCAP